MKLANIRSARSIWLVPINDINQRGKFILPAVAGLVQRYSFQKPPDAASLVASPTKVSFEVGAFTATDGTPIYVNMMVHDDGIVVDTRTSTEEADRFLEDVLGWLSSEFQLTAVAELGIKRLYVSELVVVFDREPSVFSETMERFASTLRFSTSDRPLKLINLSFGADPTEARQNNALSA